ncbi:MAG: kelch repeat-containing protein [Candidatus Thorarchaeota archaeon]
MFSTKRLLRVTVIFGLLSLFLVCLLTFNPQLSVNNSPSRASDFVGTAFEGAQDEMDFPLGRANLMMAYDIESDITIIYGGWKTPEPFELGDTWSYDFDNDSYTNLNPTISPPVREVSQMVYDSQSDKMVMFGGLENYNDLIYRKDTWTYDYNTNSWENVTTSVAPGARGAYGMVYDSESDRIILFGGEQAGVGIFNDTWAFDVETSTWEKMNPAIFPSSRYFPSMAYDEESDRVILFSGRGVGPEKIASTWAYDYNTDSWQDLSPSTQPPWLRAHDMTYDNESDTIVLFGGSNVDDFAQDDTWLFDYNTNTWTLASPDTSPSPRLRESMVYDVESDIIISFGGTDFGYYGGAIITTDITWVYDVNSDNWTQMAARPISNDFSISLLSQSPAVPSPDEAVRVLAIIPGAESAKVQYKIGTADWTNVTMNLPDTIWIGSIPGQPEGTTVTYRVVAINRDGIKTMSSVSSYTVFGTNQAAATFPVELITIGAIAGVIIVLVVLIVKERR